MTTKVTSAMSTGSGTTVKFNDQPVKSLVPPPATISAKNKVHSPFAELPVKPDSEPEACIGAPGLNSAPGGSEVVWMFPVPVSDSVTVIPDPR